MIPKSIPEHISSKSEQLWQIPDKNIEWEDLDLSQIHIISGSAFIDQEDPYGTKGNPFCIVVGSRVGELTFEEKQKIAEQTGTPETVFIHYVKEESTNIYTMLLTVLTPTGKELGACAHGFTGAIQTGISLKQIKKGSTVKVQTTLETSARSTVSNEGVIALEFKSEMPRDIRLEEDELANIFGVNIELDVDHIVLSVGSPKLTIEVAQEDFEKIRQAAAKIDHSKLLAFQEKYKINGIHIFSRDLANRLPVNSMQINGYLGENNFIDPATGVSNAAQVSADENVNVGQTVKITQFTPDRASAELAITKGDDGVVFVGGAAVLVNNQVGR